MSANHRRLKALLYLIVLFPLWWLQRTEANPLSPALASLDGDHDHDDDDGDHDDDCDDNDDSDDDDDGDDDDDSDDDDGGGEITDCNHNGIDDAIDIQNGTSPDQNLDGVPDECQSKIIYYCQGNPQDGGGVECPCGNTVPSGTMAGCLNRAGHGASLTATGTPSVSDDTLVLTATGLPLGVPGFFFQGDGGLARVSTGNGVRCIDHFIRMRKIVHSTGGDTIPVPGGPSISEEFHITAGATKYYQVLYRDNGGPCGGAVNATNVVQVIWGL